MRLSHRLRPVVCLWVLLCTALGPGMSRAQQSLSLAVAEPRPLGEVLGELEARYRVFFTYDAELIGEQEVDFELREHEALQPAMDRLLSGTGFRYDTFSDKYFVIYRDNRQGEKNARRLGRKIRQIQRLEENGEVYVDRLHPRASDRIDEAARALDRLRQPREIRGYVRSAAGEPLVGVNILLPGTAQGTSTDQNGAFSLQVPPGPAELEISYIGFASRRLTVYQPRLLQVTMQPSSNDLEEVVVIGYGSTTRRYVAGSTTTLQTAALPPAPAQSAEQLLQGQVAGVQVLNAGGEPGGQINLRIRGATSINASNEPLYVIDGVPIDNTPHNPGGFQSGRNPLFAFNPGDIASMTVLKDAAATAIYGSRGANGVILIQTKRGGTADGPRLRYDASASLSRPRGQVEVLTADELRRAMASYAPGRAAQAGQSDTDWQQTILRAGWGQNHLLSLSGGQSTTGYRASLGFSDQQGVVRGAAAQRLSLALNGYRQLFDEQLELEANFKAARVEDHFVPHNTIGNAVFFPTTEPVYDPGSKWGGYFEFPHDLAIKNPIAEIELTEDFSTALRTLTNLTLHWKPRGLKGLTGRINAGYDLNAGRRRRYLPPLLRTQSSTLGEIRMAEFTRTNFLLESYIDYLHRFGGDKHRLAFTGGYSFQHFYNDYPELRAWELTASPFSLENPAAAAQHFSAARRRLENRLISFFGRLNYTFADRYQATLTLRTDGSSRFGPANRWGAFPSAALAWRLTQEPFLRKSLSALSDLRLRISWGITGNQEIGDYQYLKAYQAGDNQVRYQFGDEFVTTVRPSAVDPNLKWEQTATWNLALDFTLRGERLGGTLEAYRQYTTDLLARVAVPAGTNLSDIILTNIGAMDNRGVELTLHGRVIDRQRLRWTLGLTLAYNRNEIVKLTRQADHRFRGFTVGDINGGTGNTIQLLSTGQPLYAFLVLRHRRDGDGRPLADGVDHNGDGRVDLLDLYEDLNDDGRVDDHDKSPYGKPAPDVTLGLNSHLSFDRFSLDWSLRAQAGNYVYNNVAALGGHYSRLYQEFAPVNLPRSVVQTGFLNAQYFSDYYVEDASFARLDHITVAYRAGRNRTWQLYTTLQNAWVLTRYTGLDPEIGNVSGNAADPRFGIDDNVFPRARTLLLGIKLEW